MSIENEETQPLRTANKRIEESVAESYKRIQAEEDNKIQAKIEEAAAKKYEEVRRLGFVTKKIWNPSIQNKRIKLTFPSLKKK